MDRETWNEALSLAKDQLHHGKIHFSELESTTLKIFESLNSLMAGPVLEVEAASTEEVKIEKHEVTADGVKCAICGKVAKVLTKKHLAKHNISREEYLKRFNVKKKDMHIVTNRPNVSGMYNPLKVMNEIMKGHGIERNAVQNYVKQHGYDSIKALLADAKEKKVAPFSLLKEKDKAFDAESGTEKKKTAKEKK